jgi:hypothetical protein
MVQTSLTGTVHNKALLSDAVNRALTQPAMQKSMNKSIPTEEACSKLSELLIGCSINKVSYFITGWELRLIGEIGPEIYLYAADIRIPDEGIWWEQTNRLPIDLKNTNEASDTLSAIVIFTVTNKWPISDIGIDQAGNLKIYFANGCELYIPALVDHVDWTWQIDDEKRNNIITCESGPLYGNIDYFTQ